MKVLFLCTGNYYRSRFAEELFNFLCHQIQAEHTATSRGLAVERGIFNIGPISKHARKALKAHGIVLQQPVRNPQAVCEEDFRNASLTIALDEDEHRVLMEERFPKFVQRVEYWHIRDIDKLHPSSAMPQLSREVRMLLRRLG